MAAAIHVDCLVLLGLLVVSMLLPRQECSSVGVRDSLRRCWSGQRCFSFSLKFFPEVLECLQVMFFGRFFLSDNANTLSQVCSSSMASKNT